MNCTIFLLIPILCSCLCLMLAVAFFTLLERGVISYAQVRKGPNKLSVLGLVQPLADALKLIIKELVIPHVSNRTLFLFFSGLSLLLALTLWCLYPSAYSIWFTPYGLLLFLCISSVSVYSVLGAGWASNSKYSFLGSLRSAAQTVSYEVSLILILFLSLFSLGSMDWCSTFMANFPVAMLFPPLLFLWVSTCLAETHRAPFDFAEGESELVSGYSVEFSAGLFTLLFLSEYLNILFMAMTSVVWFLLFVNNLFIFLFTVLGLASLFLVIRSAYPRLRYDLLMMVCWKAFLPASISALVATIFLITQ
uniref:NADH-ubiquinone oxidoreductase chain 1 n=1 Tax=Imerinia grandidieri TaxID=3244470 RepID=G8HQX4_9EUPU|nr:NADH dehydrogenase subunit 1 [Rhopalocaulis grandidieri]